VAKLIVTHEINTEHFSEVEVAEWKKVMGCEDDDISDMIPDLTSGFIAENIADLAAYVLPSPEIGGKSGGMPAASEMHAGLTNPRVRSAGWDG